MNMLITVMMLCMAGLIVLALVFLGVWIYRDAKSRGLNAGLWTAIVILVPNLIGLLLYFLIGRKEMVKCEHCYKSVQNGSSFCPHCGERMPLRHSRAPENKGGRGLLAGFIVCIVLTITLAVGVFVLALREDPNLISSKVAVGMIENNIGDKWNISFRSLSGETKKGLRIKEGTPDKVYIKSDIESGVMTLDILQGEKIISVNLDNGMQQIEKSLEGFDEGKVTLLIKASGAKDGKVNIWWK